ncbi:MAG TPA: molybdopterin-dependent oxidoreductase [Halanaerobiales bacterium]|nr:molybdopterin-dependent oxidoreductase [Halanaerobiales bacterium]
MKNKKIIFSVLIILVIVIAVTAYINRGSLSKKDTAQKEAIVTFKIDGEEVDSISMDHIKEQGEKTFSKELDTSDSGPVEQHYTGVPLKNILNSLDIDMGNKEQVIVKAIDGYTVALTAEEVMMGNNVYLIYKNNGEFLKTKKQGGTGPYRLVIREDQFGQRWNKFVTEVNIK